MLGPTKILACAWSFEPDIKRSSRWPSSMSVSAPPPLFDDFPFSPRLRSRRRVNSADKLAYACTFASPFPSSPSPTSTPSAKYNTRLLHASCHGNRRSFSPRLPISAAHDAKRPPRRSRRNLGSAPRSSRDLLHLAAEGDCVSRPAARRRRCRPEEHTSTDEGFHRDCRRSPASVRVSRRISRLPSEIRMTGKCYRGS